MSAVPERKAVVAGQFYPREPEHLRAAVEQYLDASGIAPAEGAVAAVVAPHAGYVYSGPTAGHAFARVRTTRPARVILLGCSHRYLIGSASVYRRGGFETPLGTFPIDETLADTVSNAIGASSPEPHVLEHALEVQLPFLAVAVGLVPIVPVLFGAPVRSWHAEAGSALAEFAGPDDLLVASTDLSHYLSDETAQKVDRQTIEAVLTQDCERLFTPSQGEEHAMCGAAAVVVAMAYAKARGATKWQLLDYRTSAAASGDSSRVVGYAALSMEHAA